MLPHTALRTARPSWQPAAPVPVSEPGRRAVGRQRGPGRPCGRLRGGADRRAPAAYADPVGPAAYAVYAVYGPRGAEGRAVEGARMHPQPPGAYGARTRGGYGPDVVEGASRRGGRGLTSAGAGSRERHAGGAAGASDRRARELHAGGAGAAGASVLGRLTLVVRYGNAPPPGPSIGVPRAFPRRSPGARRTGRCGAHVPLACARAATPGGEWPPSWCLGVMRPRRGAWG